MRKSSPKATTNKLERTLISNHWIQVAFLWGTVAVLALLALGFHVSFWIGELFVSYTPQILILFSGLIMAHLTLAMWDVISFSFTHYFERIKRRNLIPYALIMVLGLYSLVYSSQIVSSATLVEAADNSTASFKIATFNKLLTSTEYARDTDILVAEGADIIALQEVDESEIRTLAKKFNYEHMVFSDCGCSAAETVIGLVSRYPITNSQTVYEHPNAGIVRSVVDIGDKGGEVVVYSVHLHAPFFPSAVSDRTLAYEQLKDSILAESLPVFVAGDFNTTVFSPQLRDFTNETKKAISTTHLRSWPKCSWFGPHDWEAVCIRIDHVFVPSGSSIHSVHIGDSSSSDHRPVIVEVSL